MANKSHHIYMQQLGSKDLNTDRRNLSRNSGSMSLPEKIDAREIAIQLSRQILSGEIGLLLGVRKLLPNLFVLGLDMHPDFIVFKAVDSEEDHLPTGPERVHWNKQALSEKDIEIEQAEQFHGESVLTACKALTEYLEQLKL